MITHIESDKMLAMMTNEIFPHHFENVLAATRHHIKMKTTQCFHHLFPGDPTSTGVGQAEQRPVSSRGPPRVRQRGDEGVLRVRGPG